MRLSTATACAMSFAWTVAVSSQERGSPAKPKPLEWRSKYLEGLRAAEERRCALLLYLPPANGQNDPPIVLRLPQALGVPPLVEAVRASADEVLDLMGRFRIKKLPAVVLLDRRENALGGWEGGVPPDLPARIQSALKKIEERDARDSRIIADAKRLSKSGNREAAYKKVSSILDSSLTSLENLAEARAVEAELVNSLRAAALKLLASEGVDRLDRDIAKDLEALGAATAHAGFKQAVAREVNRLLHTVIGGR